MKLKKHKGKVMIQKIIVILCIFTISAYSQQQEEPVSKSKKTIVRMGGAGGFTPLLLFWDVNKINKAIYSENVPKLQNRPIYLYGGQGYGYIMLLENLRIGGMGVGGQQSSSLIDVTDQVRRDLDATVNIGGVTIDYVLPILERLDFTAGICLGWGSLNFKIRRDNYNLKFWYDLISDWGNNKSEFNFQKEIDGSFFIAQPSINLEYAILRWISLRVGVSYLKMLNPEWKLDDKFEVVGVPSDLTANGIVINTGIFFGTFIF